ncbi:hypothetical protein D3C71_2168410 [compost metagenome]
MLELWREGTHDLGLGNEQQFAQLLDSDVGVACDDSLGHVAFFDDGSAGADVL